MKKIKNILILCGYMLVSFAVTAQNTNLQDELKRGRQLRLTYNLDDALGVFNKLLQQETDSIFRMEILREIMFCENGKNMLKFTATPIVVAYQTVSLKEFYYYYDLSLSGFWSLTPKSLLKELDVSEIKPFVYVSSKNPEVIYFDSRGNDERDWDIYETHMMPNNEWSAPERLSETVNTPFDERFPYLCHDGLTLYFASNGHYGMGGYDLYKTVKDPITGEWSIPENLGFPISSTDDDILYVPDDDNLYACFASTRNAGKDSITVYKIALEGTPVKQPLNHWPDIVKAATLHSPVTPVYIEKIAITAEEDSPEAKYQQQVQELQKFRQRNNTAQIELDQLRTDYSKTTDAQERKTLSVKIDLREQTLTQYQQEIKQLNKQIQELEYDLLTQGITTPAITHLPITTDTPISYLPKQTTLTPRPEKIISIPEIIVQAPIIAVTEIKDFTLRTKTESRVFENERIDGISYRYQIGVFSKKPDMKTFKGYTPVFIDERNGKWACCIGSFRTYAEAQKYTTIIKREFNDAMLVAYKDNKPIEVRIARIEEGKKPAGTTITPVNKNVAYQIVLGETLPNNLHKILQQATSKEIARIVVEGKTQYVAGPYSSKDEADKVVAVLQQSGFTDVSLNTIERK
ncbi:MAG: hypothetical protein LBH91_03335 [Prevotellaceae bacterium]|jgi:hypothetical protein|nr:hypothetical protein [Prevotellaceae bacterium]